MFAVGTTWGLGKIEDADDELELDAIDRALVIVGMGRVTCTLALCFEKLRKTAHIIVMRAYRSQSGIIHEALIARATVGMPFVIAIMLLQCGG